MKSSFHRRISSTQKTPRAKRQIIPDSTSFSEREKLQEILSREINFIFFWPACWAKSPITQIKEDENDSRSFPFIAEDNLNAMNTMINVATIQKYTFEKKTLRLSHFLLFFIYRKLKRIEKSKGVDRCFGSLQKYSLIVQVNREGKMNYLTTIVRSCEWSNCCIYFL